MPVDHDERRRKIAEVTATVIAHEGLDAATIRRIAAELGGPTKIITYYFAEKHELLHFTWQFIAQQYADEVAGLAPNDIIGRLMAMAASDEAGITRWRVYAGFWDRAARDPVFAELQRRHIALALDEIGGVVRALGVEAGEVERISLLLNAIVQGISVQALADRELWSEARIRTVLTDQAQLLLGRPLP
jgi:AcrR family transcriptional regulator